jgi:hypothetical protein
VPENRALDQCRIHHHDGLSSQGRIGIDQKLPESNTVKIGSHASGHDLASLYRIQLVRRVRAGSEKKNNSMKVHNNLTWSITKKKGSRQSKYTIAAPASRDKRFRV